MYNDRLLDHLTLAKNATRIGLIISIARTCADDCAVGADSPCVLQSLLDIGVYHSKMERYILQPDKSGVLEILNKLKRTRQESRASWDLNGVKMLTVGKTMHVGICRSADTDVSAVAKNVKKAKPKIDKF